MYGIKKETRRMGVKGQGDLYGEGLGDGVCPECGEWHAELGSDGLCRERECREKRAKLYLKFTTRE